MKKIYQIFSEALIRLSLLCVIIFLLLYVYAIIGSQFFAGKLRFTQNNVDLLKGYEKL